MPYRAVRMRGGQVAQKDRSDIEERWTHAWRSEWLTPVCSAGQAGVPVECHAIASDHHQKAVVRCVDFRSCFMSWTGRCGEVAVVVRSSRWMARHIDVTHDRSRARMQGRCIWSKCRGRVVMEWHASPTGEDGLPEVDYEITAVKTGARCNQAGHVSPACIADNLDAMGYRSNGRPLRNSVTTGRRRGLRVGC